MNRYFAIFHGLAPAAPWGVACERRVGSPKAELLMLCRTEKEAVHYAELTNFGHTLKTYRDEKVAQRSAKRN